MKTRIMSLSLATAIVVTLLFGAVTVQSQRNIAEKVVRLHVVANSDTDEDQALKLKVRDAVLGELDTLLDGIESRAAAKILITENLDKIAEVAAKEIKANGERYPVKAALIKEEFPTREYDTFSLPAGVYTSLRVSIGEAEGKNWWCVVFPPLCKAAALEDISDEAGLTKGEVYLISGEKDSIEIRFKVLEFFKTVRSRLK